MGKKTKKLKLFSKNKKKIKNIKKNNFFKKKIDIYVYIIIILYVYKHNVWRMTPWPLNVAERKQ